MSDIPTPLFLVILAGVGTALLSPLNVNGIPFVVLAIPLALLAAYHHGSEAGILVGVAGSALAGLLTFPIDAWMTISYSLASGIAVMMYEEWGSKQKDIPKLAAAALIGAVVFELAFDLQTGTNRLFREENFLGSASISGLRILGTVILTWLVVSVWPAKKK
jgi:hypothetical protein